MKIQKLILTAGAIAAFGLGSVNPVQAGEFKLLQNLLNMVSGLGGESSSSNPQTNTTAEIGPVIDPVKPKREPLVPGPIRPKNPRLDPFGPPPLDPYLGM